jgi:CBS domain-containing protein
VLGTFRGFALSNSIPISFVENVCLWALSHHSLARFPLLPSLLVLLLFLSLSLSFSLFLSLSLSFSLFLSLSLSSLLSRLLLPRRSRSWSLLLLLPEYNLGRERSLRKSYREKRKKKEASKGLVALFLRLVLLLSTLNPPLPPFFFFFFFGKKMPPARRPAAANNQVVRAHLSRKTVPAFLSELLRKEEEEQGKKEGEGGERRRRRPKSLITLSPQDSLPAASAALAAARVLSAPVVEPSGNGTFRGFFDVADYLRAVVELAREKCPELLPLLDSASSSSVSPSAAAQNSSSSLLPKLLEAANDDRRRVKDCAHAAGEAWFRIGGDDGGDEESSMLDVVVSGFRATARVGRKGSSSSSAAFLAAAADPLSRPAHRVAVFGIEKQNGGGEEGGKKEKPLTTTTADGPALCWRVRGVISQTDVISYIAQRSEGEFEPALRQSVAELGFAPGVNNGGAASASAAAPPSSSSSSLSPLSSSLAAGGASSSPLVVLPAGTPALAAFATMVSRRASAVALVDDGDCEGIGGGALLACLTNSDLRGFRGGDHFAALLRPAAEIAAAVAVAESSGSDGGIWASDGPLLKSTAAEEEEESGSRDWRARLAPARARLVSVAPEASLGEALRKAAAARVHRVWVVDGASGRPVGVLGLTDMLRVLVQEDDE